MYTDRSRGIDAPLHLRAYTHVEERSRKHRRERVYPRVSWYGAPGARCVQRLCWGVLDAGGTG